MADNHSDISETPNTTDRKSKPKKHRAAIKTSKKLSLKERTFVTAIASPGSPTYGNGTQSVLKAGYDVSLPQASKYAWELRRKPEIALAIDQLFNKHNLGIEVRTRKLTAILSSDISVTTQKDKNGKVVAVTEAPNTKYQLQALHMVNKMDGTYARAETIGHAQGKAIEPLIEEYSRKLRAELRQGMAQGSAQAPQDAISPPSPTDSVPTEYGTPTGTLQSTQSTGTQGSAEPTSSDT